MISIKKIRLLTNMSTGQINRSLNELKNKDLELFDEISEPSIESVGRKSSSGQRN